METCEEAELLERETKTAYKHRSLRPIILQRYIYISIYIYISLTKNILVIPYQPPPQQ